MTQNPPNDPYRKAMESDDGFPVSAGARMAHVKAAAEAGRSVQVDLSDVPAELRPALLVEIRELIQERAARAAKSPRVGVATQPGDKPVTAG
ncbi:MAG TPA: hypothetical protein VH092_22655 [Urbifossiella sp.]|jgi:hypothetical protein|nr:hypothetical protein [Urbifossiella sp.]